MGSVGTSIIGRPRRLPRHRRATARYTLDCEEPHKHLTEDPLTLAAEAILSDLDLALD